MKRKNKYLKKNPKIFSISGVAGGCGAKYNKRTKLATTLTKEDVQSTGNLPHKNDGQIKEEEEEQGLLTNACCKF